MYEIKIKETKPQMLLQHKLQIMKQYYRSLNRAIQKGTKDEIQYYLDSVQGCYLQARKLLPVADLYWAAKGAGWNYTIGKSVSQEKLLDRTHERYYKTAKSIIDPLNNNIRFARAYECLTKKQYRRSA